MKLTLVRREPVTHDVEGFWWRPQTACDFRPGQFLHWRLPHDHPDDRGERRFFSIASAPAEPEILVATKFATEKGSSFKQAWKQLAIGTELEATGPSGSFVLNDEPNENPVLVAGGIGVTPFRSMIRQMQLTGRFKPFHLIHACRIEDDAAFRELFAPVSDQYPQAQITYQFGGKLSAAAVYEAEPAAKTRPVFLSGPEPMIKALKGDLLQAGQPEDLIRTDYFPGYAQI